MERSKRSRCRVIYPRKSGSPAPSSPSITRTSVFTILLKREGVGRGLRWTVFLALNSWNGFSGLAWLRTAVRQHCMGSSYSRVVCSSTSGRSTTSKTVASITASWPKTQNPKYKYILGVEERHCPHPVQHVTTECAVQTGQGPMLYLESVLEGITC